VLDELILTDWARHFEGNVNYLNETTSVLLWKTEQKSQNNPESKMGIPYYVASLLRTHKHIQQAVGNAPLEVDVLGLDFNCFIHTYLKAENPVGSVVVALRNFLRDIVRAKKVLIAFDGLVPYAKIVQQRYRRMKKSEPAAFDKNQISPGTRFMDDLEEALRMVFPECEISGTRERGEGEHKIFTWLRAMPPEERKDIVIYGLDADLVLISVAQSDLGRIRLLRERELEGFSTFSIDALKSALPVEPDLWVQMCVMCFGNDFMPTIAMFSLREDGYNRAIKYAKMQDFMKAVEEEDKIITTRSKNKHPFVVTGDAYAMEARFGIHLMDGVLDWEKVCYAFWKTYEWTLHYFKTSEVLDWCWYYPYAEAPLLRTLCDCEITKKFEWEYPEPPFGIEDQINFIMPGLGVYPDERYEEGPDSRYPWMKAYAWETDPLISLPWNPSKPMTHVTWIDSTS